MESDSDDLVRFVAERGEPWFQSFGPSEVLISSPDTPLRPESIARLQAALRGDVDPGHIARSRKLLGIKAPKTMS